MRSKLEQIRTLNQQAWAICKKDGPQAIELAQQAHSLLSDCAEAQPIDERVKFDKGQLAIIMLDVDHFKNVNDRYGHKAGDEVLSAVGARIKKSLRQDDVAGRYGGEEFVVLLVDSASDQCINIAERIRQAVAQQAIQIDQDAIRVTVSLGLACIDPERVRPLDVMINSADQALYLAKQQGRNRVVAWTQNEKSAGPETTQSNDVNDGD